MMLKIGDRVTTTSGKTGVIIPSEWLMPVHHLVHLDGGSKRWMLRKILRPKQIIKATA
ncbi:MAG: hypothetical protein KME11_12440 [Timaviella obliquedivisa GSE-PSE-MK23-08B]|jgi:hypothetical protein|nr:hypothetical protein [Timaviella obliquedivisa GSE-PSE-MK23-08B]